MIKKASLVAVVLFIAYASFVCVAPKWWHVAQSQGQGNIVKAQKFIYSNQTYVNVIVGSSLANRIIADSLPNTYNLCFDGLSIYDGLNILTHKINLPKTVFIETNVALRTEDADFISGLFAPIQYYSKKNIIALQDDKQPIGIIGDQIYWRVTNKLIDRFKSMFHSTSINKKVDTKNDLLSKMLAIQVKDYSKTPDKKIVNESFTKLKNYITALENRGTHIVFFEMPVNKELVNLPTSTIVKSNFLTNFPATKYAYIFPNDSINYITVDGLHLYTESAMAYTSYLKTKINMLK